MEQRVRTSGETQPHLLCSTKHITSNILFGFVHYFCFDLEVDDKKKNYNCIFTNSINVHVSLRRSTIFLRL